MGEVFMVFKSGLDSKVSWVVTNTTSLGRVPVFLSAAVGGIRTFSRAVYDGGKVTSNVMEVCSICCMCWEVRIVIGDVSCFVFYIAHWIVYQVIQFYRMEKSIERKSPHTYIQCSVYTFVYIQVDVHPLHIHMYIHVGILLTSLCVILYLIYLCLL